MLRYETSKMFLLVPTDVMDTLKFIADKEYRNRADLVRQVLFEYTEAWKINHPTAQLEPEHQKLADC